MRKIRRSIQLKLVLPVLFILLLCLATAWILVPSALIKSARQHAGEAALQVANQFKVIRGYYTRSVIGPVVASDSLAPSIHHAEDKSKVPLPATMIHDLSRLLADTETTVTLYSPYPFPNRTNNQLDDFQQSAWDFLNENPDDTFERLEMQDGVPIVRVAISDRLVAQGCVDCHNTYAGTPKNDWQLGDVRGVLEVDRNISGMMASAELLTTKILLGILIAGLVIGAILLASVKSIASPVRVLTKAMDELSKGNLETEIPTGKRTDEIGDMATSLGRFQQAALEKQESDRHLAESVAEQQAQAAKLSENEKTQNEIGLCREDGRNLRVA